VSLHIIHTVVLSHYLESLNEEVCVHDQGLVNKLKRPNCIFQVREESLLRDGPV